MDFGLVLPTVRAGSSPEGIEAATDAAERTGLTTLWTTDHILVDHSAAGEYGRTFDLLITLAYIAGRHPNLKLATSVIVVPMRQAVVVAKDLATLDAMSRGRVIAGVGVGWHRVEFENLEAGDRYGVRGAYLEEAIRLWRHLWSGSSEPFHGRFHHLTDFVFEPLPAQGAGLPILVGGRTEPALRRAGRLGDGYHANQTSPVAFAERIPIVRAAAEAVGRPMPGLTARVRVEPGASGGDGYALRGTPEEMRAEIRAFEGIGLTHLGLAFGPVEPDALVRQIEWFAREVVSPSS